jgi:hypothetical protein
MPHPPAPYNPVTPTADWNQIIAPLMDMICPEI